MLILLLVVWFVSLSLLAYFSVPIWGWAIGLIVLLQVSGAPLMLFILVLLACAALGYSPIRQKIIISPIFKAFKKVIPTLSKTEREAIDAGTVWWDAEIFSGKPDWKALDSYQDPKLTDEEQAFLDGPVETLCKMINDWEVVHKNHDLSPQTWAYLKKHRFFAMIIQKEYGGLAFSNYAHAKVVGKIASRSLSAAITVMVPNSLGPGELLQHYGTQKQRDYYLPRLADGTDIPCFALTSPYAGSDAGAIPDFGVVEHGDYTDPRTGEHHKNVLGIRLSFEKRWITLGPIATVFGLAFNLKDPDHLLGDKENIGITCALLPKGTAGLMHERRHYPNNSPFQNGPVWGKDVFIPLEWIIGGVDYAGQGWRMLMECLSIGRCISLPALAVASGKLASYTTAAYVGIRHQFGLPLGRFEGVDEAVARIGGHTYQMEAAQNLALIGLDSGEKPSVISAIIKYHNTERMRQCLNDAMDVVGGRAVVTGPRNFLASSYNAVPVAITVEGANILTRSLMIFGQGAFRCHRYILDEIFAFAENDVAKFDKAFCGHIKQSLRNTARSMVLGVSNGLGTDAPAHAGELKRYYQQINRLSSAFAISADMALASLGGSLKFKEKLSARLGDAFASLYIASAVLKHYESQGANADDLPFAKWAVEKALFDTETALDGFLKNLPNRSIAWLLRRIVFPIGRRCHAPSDDLGTAVTRTMMDFSAPLERLSHYMYIPNGDPYDINEPIAALKPALQAIRDTAALEKKVRKAVRAGALKASDPLERLAEAVEEKLITEAEREQMIAARRLMRVVITVDDFDMALKEHNADLFERIIFLAS